jgi:hypothetical protein
MGGQLRAASGKVGEQRRLRSGDKKIFKSGTYPNNDKIKQLAFQLGAYRSFIEHRKAVISREKERHRRIRDALDVLIELLPGDRKEKEEQDARTAAT